MAVSAIVFLDILPVFPSPWREQIWGVSWLDRIVQMRDGGYGMLIALLRANSKGVNPLKLDCWTTNTTPSASTPPVNDPFINLTWESYSPESASQGAKKRKKTKQGVSVPVDSDVERERNILLGLHSPAALQGMIALKSWNAKYSSHMKEGEDMFLQNLRLANISPIAGLWRLFELK